VSWYVEVSGLIAKGVGVEFRLVVQACGPVCASHLLTVAFSLMCVHVTISFLFDIERFGHRPWEA
jgi:hypothetical protein